MRGFDGKDYLVLVPYRPIDTTGAYSDGLGDATGTVYYYETAALLSQSIPTIKPW